MDVLCNGGEALFTLTVTRTVGPGGAINLVQLLTSGPLTSQPASDTPFGSLECLNSWRNSCLDPKTRKGRIAAWSKNRTLFVLWSLKNQEALSS